MLIPSLKQVRAININHNVTVTYTNNPCGNKNLPEIGSNIDIFLEKLEGVSDPEKKRKVIGEQFIRSFEDATQNIQDISFLAQGTLYPDVIESGGSKLGPAVTIKSHHNVGGLPDDIKFRLIEPLRDLFKDEVRQVGKKLKLTSTLLNRHPFPGPGLAIRIPGKIDNDKIKLR